MQDILRRLKAFKDILAPALDGCMRPIAEFGVAVAGAVLSATGIIASLLAEASIIADIPATIAFVVSLLGFIASLAGLFLSAQDVSDCLNEQLSKAEKAGDGSKVTKLQKIIKAFNENLEGIKQDANKIKELANQLKELLNQARR